MRALDLANQKFGALTTTAPVKINSKRGYECLCECGNKVNRTVSQLRAGGRYQSCGCKLSEVYEQRNNLVGDKFGNVIVVQRLGTHIPSKSVLYKCLCNLCGRYFERNSKSLLRKTHKWEQNCGCAGRPKSRLPGDQAIINKLVGHYASNAKKRNLIFLLTNEYCLDLFKRDCFYCGVEPKQKFTHKTCRGEFIYNGIDRVDNSQGYTPSNCVACCSTCNYKKSNMNGGEFLEWISKVYDKSVRSPYNCNLCSSILKQLRFDGDDRIWSCSTCKMGSDSAFELRFDGQGKFMNGYCAAVINNKPMVMITYHEFDNPYTEIYEAHLNQISVPQNSLTINAGVGIANLTPEKMKLYLLFS
jgi:hypothetical protein